MIQLIDENIFEQILNEKERDKSKSNYLSLFDPLSILNIFKKVPRSFEISTNNGSCFFNTQIIEDLSYTISEFLNMHPNETKYKLDIEDNKALKKLEEICLGNITSFDKKELIEFHNIANMLEIQNCPDYMRMETYERHIKKRISINPDCEAFINGRLSKMFTISTHQKDYECNLFGICSSRVLNDFITTNKDSISYTYDYEDEYCEFQQICDFFNFEQISITTANLDFLKEISEDLQIDIISSRIKCIDQEQEKMVQRIDEEQKTVELINQLFEWLYKINELSVKTVKNSILSSEWCKSEENVQEMAAFILQVIKTNDLLHSNLIELLIQLDSENSEELKILLPFIKKKLLKTIDQTIYNCEFTYRLYYKGMITKEELFPKLTEIGQKQSMNLNLWFLPELIELGCFDERRFNNRDKSIISYYYPDKMDLYKKIRDSFEPDDEITKALRIDDVDTFQSIISSKQIKDISICFIPPNIFDSFIYDKISYLNYSAAFGSIKCFKYLMLNHSKIDSHTFYFSLCGGNFEIIKIVDNQKQSINDYNDKHKNSWGTQNRSGWGTKYNPNYEITQILMTLIENHKNDLFDWVFEQKITNYKSIHDNLDKIISTSVSNGNAHALVSIVEKGFNIFNFNKYTNLKELAASTGFYHLLKFLHKIGGKRNDNETGWGRNNSNYVSFGNLNIFKFYVDTNKSDALSSVLQNAIVNDQSKMYNYFFDQQSKKITTSIISSSFSKALEKETDELFYYFIEKFKKVCPSVFEKFTWNLSLLGLACQHGQIKPFYTIINSIKEERTQFFTSCLSKAASSNSMEICKYLIDNNYNINYDCLFQELANISNVSSEIISYLFNSSGLEFDKIIFLPLLLPAIKNHNKHFVEFLIERGIFYDECLIDAASACDLDIVNIILKHNSTPEFVNQGSEDGTALHQAVNKNSLEIFQRLMSIQSINPYLHDKNRKTPLMLATSQMNFPIIKAIISFSGQNIIYHRESIDCLIEGLIKSFPSYNYGYNSFSNYGSKICSKDDILETLEMISNIPNIEVIFDGKNQKLFPDACSRSNIDIKIIQFFIKIKTIDINCYSLSNGETALTSAVKSQRIDILKLLINDPRTDVNITNTNHESALHLAVRKSSLEMVKLLFSVPSIKPYLYDRNKKTPLMIAVNQMDLPIINEFISFSGKEIIYNKESVDHLLESLIRSISGNQAQNNFYNNNNRKYTEDDAIQTLQMLLSIDGIQMIFDEKNRYIFLSICSRRDIKINLVQLFINFDKFDLNFYSPMNGNTPLITALKAERVDIAELLINDPRTNINMINFAHESALIIAAQKQFTSIVKLLINNKRFDPVKSRADYAFIISKDEISEILLSMNLFDVNCVNIDVQRTRRYGWGTSSSSSSAVYKKGETALIQAAKNANLTRFEQIIKHPTFDKNKSQLSKATDILFSLNNKEKIKDFLNILKDNNLFDDFVQNIESFHQLINNGNIDILKEIFEGKFGPFVVSDEMIQKLFFFTLKVTTHSPEIMSFLINYDKEHNKAIDFKKESFLTNIITENFFTKDRKKIYKAIEDTVNLIVENGGDVNMPNKYNTYPLENAISNEDVALVHALLETHKVDFNIKSNTEIFLYGYRSRGWGRPKDEESRGMNTYLHMAAASRHSKILKMLIEMKAIDVNVKNTDDETPLIIACRCLLDRNVKILFTRDDLDFHCKNNQNEDVLQIVNKIGGKSEYIPDNQGNSNDSLTKEQYLNKIIDAINEIKYGRHHMSFSEQYDNYEEEEEENNNDEH